MLDLNDLYYFSVVVEKKGISTAAETIGIPKGTLSKRLRGLEQSLGLRLANRTTRSFSLTEAGADFHGHCLRVMQAVRDAERAAQARISEPVGRVRISCASGVVRIALDSLIPSLLAQYPKIDIDVIASSRYVDLVEEGYDIALRSHTVPLENSTMIARALTPNRVVLMAAPQLFARGVPVTPEQLDGVAGLQLVSREAAPSWLLHAADGRTEPVRYYPRVRSNDAPFVVRAALAGLGVAALPLLLCRQELATGALVRVLPDWHIAQGTLSAVLPSHRGMSPAIRATLDFLVRKLPGLVEGQLDDPCDVGLADPAAGIESD